MESNTPSATNTRGLFRMGGRSLFATAGVAAALILTGTAFAQTGNNAPVAAADTTTVVEDTATLVNVLANDTDSDGNTLTITGFTTPAHGVVASNAGASLTYTPAANYHGADSFEYTISDGNGGSATATVTVTVTPVNDPPVAVADMDSSVIGSVSIPVLANDTDVDGDTLTLVSATQGANGTTTVTGSNVLYTPNSAFLGADTFTYVVSDGHGGTATGTVALAVLPAGTNVAPVAVDDTVSVKFETAKRIAVLANDTDANGGDILTVGSVTSPAHGTAVIDAAGKVLYTPATGYSGPDSFTYIVRDQAGLIDTGTVNITVKAATNGDDDDDDEDRDHANRGDMDDCKDGGWIDLGFRNQGQCVSTAARGGDVHANADRDDDDDDDHEAVAGASPSSGSHGKSQGKGRGRN